MRIHAVALAAILAGAPFAAQAATVTFDALGGDNGDAFTSYNEAGFTVTKTAGDAFVGKAYGNPIPDIFFGPNYGSATTTLEITASGHLFSFISWDLSPNGGGAGWSVTGYQNNVVTYEAFGIDGIAGFTTIALGTPLKFDRLVFDMHAFGTSANFDNYVGDLARGVPEPQTWALMLLGFGGLGVALRRGRRERTLAA